MISEKRLVVIETYRTLTCAYHEFYHLSGFVHALSTEAAAVGTSLKISSEQNCTAVD